MTSIANYISFRPSQSGYWQKPFGDDKIWDLAKVHRIQLDSSRLRLIRGKSSWAFTVRASGVAPDSGRSNGEANSPVGRKGLDLEKRICSLREMVNALPPAIPFLRTTSTSTFTLGFSIAIAILVIAARHIMLKRKGQNYQGSVADLVRRGQLRSDRRGTSKPMKYDDPFNNPFVKIDKSSSSIEMFGKVYRLAPVTLTAEEKSVHQKRRSRAYQWKRPTVFLKEGDSIPPDIDPDTVRWIPANHPFATTVSDIDEGLAQSNVYQTDGVPFRVKAEHEAMQKKLQAFQTEQRVSEVTVNVDNFHDFERTLHSAEESNSLIDNGVDSSAGINQTS